MAKKARPRRTNSRYARERELERIERILDEDFETLSEARKALTAETGAVPGKASYTVSELSSRKHKTVKAFISDIESHSKELDGLKQDKDFWAAEIYGNKTYALYGSMEQLARKLASYRGLQEEHPRAALKHVKIVRVSGVNALADYRQQKQFEVEESWRLAKLKGKVDRKRKKRQEKQIEQLRAEVKRLRKKLRS